MKRIKKGDIVIVRSGNDKGRQGKVMRIFPKKNKALVENVAILKKYVKANAQQNITGGIVPQESPIALSKLSLYNPETQKRDKVVIKIGENNKKIRYFHSNNKKIELN